MEAVTGRHQPLLQNKMPARFVGAMAGFFNVAGSTRNAPTTQKRTVAQGPLAPQPCQAVLCRASRAVPKASACGCKSVRVKKDWRLGQWKCWNRRLPQSSRPSLVAMNVGVGYTSSDAGSGFLPRGWQLVAGCSSIRPQSTNTSLRYVKFNRCTLYARVINKYPFIA